MNMTMLIIMTIHQNNLQTLNSPNDCHCHHRGSICGSTYGFASDNAFVAIMIRMTIVF